MEIDYDAMEKRIDDYFANVTDEELEISMERAGYSTYKYLDGLNIFSDDEIEIINFVEIAENRINENL